MPYTSALRFVIARYAKAIYSKHDPEKHAALFGLYQLT